MLTRWHVITFIWHCWRVKNDIILLWGRPTYIWWFKWEKGEVFHSFESYEFLVLILVL